MAHPSRVAEEREPNPTGPARTIRFRCAEGSDEGIELAGPADLRIKLDRPAYVYPMFEQALRIAAGEPPDDHRRRIGELWSQFSAVAATNPYAWSREALSGNDIAEAGPEQSDGQLAVYEADELEQHGGSGCGARADVGRQGDVSADPSDRWVFPYAGTDAHDTYAISDRAEFHTSPAIRIAGNRALELAERRYRRHGADRSLLVLPVRGAGGGQRTRPADRRPVRGP